MYLHIHSLNEKKLCPLNRAFSNVFFATAATLANAKRRDDLAKTELM